jgi:hypothetical protein
MERQLLPGDKNLRLILLPTLLISHYDESMVVNKYAALLLCRGNAVFLIADASAPKNIL